MSARDGSPYKQLQQRVEQDSAHAATKTTQASLNSIQDRNFQVYTTERQDHQGRAPDNQQPSPPSKNACGRFFAYVELKLHENSSAAGAAKFVLTVVVAWCLGYVSLRHQADELQGRFESLSTLNANLQIEYTDLTERFETVSTSFSNLKDLITAIHPDAIIAEIATSTDALNSARDQSERSVNVTATLLNSLSKLNNEFSSMNTSVYKGLNAWTQLQSRVHPRVCGVTSSTNGNLNGYIGANNLCRSICGPSSSTSAHICRVSEFCEQFERSPYSTPPSEACWWLSSGNHKEYNGYGVNDCHGFSSSTGYGSCWCSQQGPQGIPGIANCANYYPVACCDYVKISELL
eukprot:gb/GEZN01009981.1/.p1 GENE.gb/GEZN01009981.1/~~gb/GEZN01009981.1/.p1  ORF type:complete len:348 (-),score=13.80 gb/GEZN01009981.1/:188-1231(-)